MSEILYFAGTRGRAFPGLPEALRWTRTGGVVCMYIDGRPWKALYCNASGGMTTIRCDSQLDFAAVEFQLEHGLPVG
jgi:hypothetical protein